MRLSTKQSDLEGKVSLRPSACPFCLPLTQVREEQDIRMPFFMYSHSFTHIAYEVEVSTQSSVFLPLPAMCMQVD